MIGNTLRDASGTTPFSEDLAFRVSGLAAQRARAAAYDAVEKVLHGLTQPIDSKALAIRWNEAVDAMTKHLENEMQG
jgi:hypothetical protein